MKNGKYERYFRWRRERIRRRHEGKIERLQRYITELDEMGTHVEVDEENETVLIVISKGFMEMIDAGTSSYDLKVYANMCEYVYKAYMRMGYEVGYDPV
jgi:ribosome-associated translation inhibitor RaiA